jgi:hypothetical protein
MAIFLFGMPYNGVPSNKCVQPTAPAVAFLKASDFVGRHAIMLIVCEPSISAPMVY